MRAVPPVCAIWVRHYNLARGVADQLDKDGKHLAVVIRGVDAFWDVSLAHFIYAMTAGSAPGNAAEIAQRGLLQPQGGVPRAARETIDGMFAAVRAGELAG